MLVTIILSRGWGRGCAKKELQSDGKFAMIIIMAVNVTAVINKKVTSETYKLSAWCVALKHTGKRFKVAKVKDILV